MLRVRARRLSFVVVVVAQLALVVRGYWSAHDEFAFQMFPESSTWEADVVRVTAGGARIPVTEAWAGYSWADLVRARGLQTPWVRHHADAGLESQLAFLGAALDWVAANTPRDVETLYLEATVTAWHNADAPVVHVLRSAAREVAA